MQHWTEINLVTLQKLIETKPQGLSLSSKLKVVQENVRMSHLFFGG